MQTRVMPKHVTFDHLVGGESLKSRFGLLECSRLSTWEAEQLSDISVVYRRMG